MPYELIITEKPSAAKKIASALASGKPIKETEKGVPYYKITHNSKDIVVGCAVGHLYTLAEKNKGKWTYPVFDVEWKATSAVRKDAKFASRYVSMLKKLAKQADEFTVATDFDIEGEVIGLNVVRFICRQKDAKRMKFSTLTKDELNDSYEKASRHLEWGQANAGLTRHELDYYYGINLSRALSLSIKAAGSFKVLSSGRVQGPALKIIVEKEKKIQAFRPKPYWQLELHGNAKGKDIIALHKEDKFWEKEKAERIHEKVKGKRAFVDNIQKKQFKQAPPHPFDLTTLQTEAYRSLRIQPKDTLALAQELYLKGLISYPRTSSQVLPKEIGYQKILKLVAKQTFYKMLAEKLLAKKQLKTNNGKKTDPAHPAIFPTGQISRIDGREAKIYDLIVRRFLSTFGEPAVRETVQIEIDVEKEIFLAKGTRTVEKGWFEFYEKHVKLEEEELPPVEKGEEINVKKMLLLEKETQPPKRYTPASIIKELEKRNLGTKCLTSNTKVKINSNNQVRNIKISKLFDDLYDNSPIKKIKNVEIALNNKKSCFSFNDTEEIKSHFKLISRRKLKQNEKVYRINFKDGSYIEATENHPFLIFDNKDCRYVKAKNLKKEMKSVTSMKFSEKKGNMIYSWEDFLNKSNIKTKLYGISNEISIKRKKQNLSQESFGKKYGLIQPNISLYEKSKSIPFYIIKKLNLIKPRNMSSVNKNIIVKNPFPLRMSSSLARIYANLVGDGSIDSKKIIKENCYDFRYHNTNIDLINRFIKDVVTVFGIELFIKQAKLKPKHLPKYYIKVPAVIGRIFSILFPEVVKKNIVKIPSQFYPEFIGALFDDEGHCMKSEPKLFISNTNFKLLENVKQMLSDLSINAMLDKKQFKLYIRGRENIQKFLEKIPIASMEKKQRLINNLSKFYKYGGRRSSLQKQFLIVSILNTSPNKELSNREISKKLGFDMPRSRHHMNLLIKNGYIKRITKGISEYPRKIISY